jgi:DNA-binding transcriptional ArsR family regulator
MKSTSRSRPLPAALLHRMADVLKVLAHPDRLKLIELLERESTAPVFRLMEVSGLPQAVVSQHLTHMRRVGLVANERRGKEVWYRIQDRSALTILDCIRKNHGARS